MPAAPARPAGVLVVDDQPLIRQLLVLGLTGCGFAAWAAGGCAEAVEALRARPGEIDAALIDVRMPGAGGLETMAALRAVKPGLPCCLMTGHAEDRDALLAAGADGVLPKPFTPNQAAEALREMLAGRG